MNRSHRPHLSILFARATRLSGVARLIDFGNGLNLYGRIDTSPESISRALRADWESVGRDLQEAIEHERAEAQTK